MKLAEYLRYSSDGQRCESIEEQHREISQWAERSGHEIIATYADSALSGKFDVRPEFQRMLAEARTARWEGVAVFDLTRFSRGGEYGIADSLVLQDAGKRLISITEQYGDDFGGKLIKHVKMLYAEEFIEQLRVNVKRGHKQNALHAMHNGGTPPLGYDVDPNTLALVINEREAEAVRMIYTMFATHHSYKAICEALNERGFKTKRNANHFTKNSLFDILGNKKYIGVYEYGKVVTQITGRTKKYVPAPPENIVTIENGCPAIIEKSLFEKVQKMREMKQHVNPRADVDYILRGKVRCARCGSAYVGSAMKSGGKKSYYYICSGKKNGKPCDNRNILKETLEGRVIDEIKKRYLSEEGIAWVSDTIRSCNKNVEAPMQADEQKSIIKQIEQLEQRLQRQKEAYYNGLLDLEELKKEKLTIDKELERLKLSLVDNSSIDLDEQGVANIIERFKQDMVTNRQIIDSLVESVLIDGEDITVNLYTSPFSPPPLCNNNPPKGNDNSGESGSESPSGSACKDSCKDKYSCVLPPPKKPYTVMDAAFVYICFFRSVFCRKDLLLCRVHEPHSKSSLSSKIIVAVTRSPVFNRMCTGARIFSVPTFLALFAHRTN